MADYAAFQGWTNYSDTTNYDVYPYVRAMDIVIAVAGFLGNSIVCFVFLSRRARDSATNNLILHQSIIDLIGVLVFFAARVLFHPADLAVPTDGIASQLYCKLWFTDFFLWGMYYTSAFNLVLIAFERYAVSCHAVWYAMVRRRGLNKVAVLLPWLAGFGSQTYMLALAHAINGWCFFILPRHSRVWGGVALYLLIFIMPLAVMFWCYCRVIRILREKERMYPRGAGHDTVLRRSRNVAYTLLIITIAYMVCVMPSETEYLLFNLGLNHHYGNNLYYVFSILNSLNLVVNPCIYTCRYKLFQRRLKKLLTRRRNRVRAVDRDVALP